MDEQQVTILTPKFREHQPPLQAFPWMRKSCLINGPKSHAVPPTRGLPPRMSLAYDPGITHQRSRAPDLPMQVIESILASWANPNTDPALRWRQVADLAKLVQRHGDFGNHPPYSFHDPSIRSLTVRLTSLELRQIAATAGRVLLDPTEAGSMRASATFLLGKTRQRSALASVLALIANPAELPAELARQAGFTFDLLTRKTDLATLGLDQRQIGAQFERHGVPWDHATQQVAVDQI